MIVVMAHKFMTYEEVEIRLSGEIDMPRTILMYPEHKEHRTGYDTYLQRLAKNDSSCVVVTDSELLLLAFRVAIKEGHIPFADAKIYSISEDWIDYASVMADGKLPYWPKGIDAYGSYLDRILD